MSKNKQLIHSSESTEFYTMEQFEYLLESNRVLRNGAVRVFVKRIVSHNKAVKVLLMYIAD